MPISNNPGNDSTKIIPASRIHCTHRDANSTAGTSADRNRSMLYPLACCNACPVSWAATAAAAIVFP